jgi:signal transduction histidine kinase
MEAGKEVVRIGPVDVGKVVEESLNLVRPQADERGLKLDSRIAEGGIRIESDRWKLRQILSNLLSNAVKFTPEGSVAVEAEQVGNRVVIRVRDTGIGISAAHLHHIFDAFWQAEQTSTRRFGGTGLGLGVARALAQLLDGELTAASTLGEGTTFTLDLPIGAPAASDLS